MASKEKLAKRRRLALLICNGSFPEIPGTDLPGPARDAETLAAVLSDPESGRFEVRTVVDQGLRVVRMEVARICARAGPEDTLLIYYSGQGIQDRHGDFHLLVADSNRAHLEATAVDADFVLGRLRASTCRKIVLLLDTCHSGAFFDQTRGVPSGLFAISSCGAEELCADTPEGGAFTLALAEGLRNAAADREGDRDGKVSIAELHEFVKKRLRDHPSAGVPQKWEWNVPEPIYLASAPRYVFLSYAREDADDADRIAAALKARGLAVWIDREEIQSGAWQAWVMEGLNKARALVLLLSAHSQTSEAVEKELDFAGTKNVPIIPVQRVDLDEDQLADWFLWAYKSLHRHSIPEDDFEAAMDGLAAAIKSAHLAPATVRERPDDLAGSRWSAKSADISR